MKRISIALSISFLLLLLVGCSPTIKLHVQKPAQLDVGKFSNVAVLDFEIDGSFSFWFDNQTVSLEDILNWLSQNQIRRTSVFYNNFFLKNKKFACKVRPPELQR